MNRARRLLSLAALAAAVVVTAGFPGCTHVVRDEVPALCEPMGFLVCESKARWDGNPEDPAAWDQLAGETLPASREETRTCEVRRKALEQCLRRLDAQGVIDLGKVK